MDLYKQKIDTCKRLIEEKLQWGNSDNWQNQDFEKLSEQLFDATGQLLSTSTLKRIWGKVKYDSKPNIATLDALAKYIGYHHWREFENAPDPMPEEATAKEIIQPPLPPAKSKWIYIAIVIPVFIVLVSLVMMKKKPDLQFSQLVFNSRAIVNRDLPNTIVFEYDASHSNADSVFIQQSWDRRLRQRVDKLVKIFTTTYYAPGYYRAKLILNDSVVKEHDVLIETDGWKGILDLMPKPVYLPNEIIIKDNALGIDQTQAATYSEGKDEPPYFVLANVNKSFFSIDSNNYDLQLQLQNTYHEPGKDVCEKTFVTLLGSNSFINIPLCKKGCVGEVTLIAGSTKLPGKTANLENFGVNFSKKINLRCQLANNIFTIFIDDVPAYTGPDPLIGKLAGVKIAFTGSGVMSDFSLKSGEGK